MLAAKEIVSSMRMSWVRQWWEFCGGALILIGTKMREKAEILNIPLHEVVVSRNKVTVDLGTLTDEYEKEISIHTTATSKDGEKTILAGKEVTIVDTVKLDGLTKGSKYQLKGWQMLKEENAELMTLPNISHSRRQRLGTWCFSILPITLVRM